MTYPVPTIGANGLLPSSGISQLATDMSFLLNGHIVCAAKPSTATLTLTTTAQDVAGCSATVTTTGTNATGIVVGFFDFSKTAAGAIARGYCNIDGADQSEQALLGDGNALADRATVGQVWVLTLAPGSHTIKLRADKTANVGTFAANNPHTKLVLAVFDNQ